MTESTGGNGTQRPKKPSKLVAVPHGRVPPHNLDAERSLLGGLLLDRAPAVLKGVAEICGAADFYFERHRKIFEAMLSLLEDTIEVDRVSVQERLVTRGDLEHAGGEEFIELLDKYVPTAANLGYYAKIVHDKARARKVIETAGAIVQLGYDQHGDVGDFIIEAEKRLRGVVEDGPEGSKRRKRVTIAGHAIKLSRERIRATPPPREFMLRDSRSGAGVYVQGRVGLFVATGGTGKTWALSQLAVSVATGTTWFGPGGWVPEKAGKVLAIFGEETQEDAMRNLHFAARASGVILDEELDLFSQNATVLGMAGEVVELTNDAGAAPFALEVHDWLAQAAKEGSPYSLVVLDPLSRFAGPDVETDNHAATRFIQVLESFASPTIGRPSIVIAHHTYKKRENDDEDSADIARGSSAIKDGARWMARLDQAARTRESADLLTIRIPKANGIPPMRVPLILCRSQDHEGALRVATAGEIASNEKLSNLVKSKVQELADYEERILEVMRSLRVDQEISGNKLAELCGKKDAVGAAINSLFKKRLIEHGKKYWRLPLSQRGLFSPSNSGTTSGTTSGSTPPKGPDLTGSSPPSPAALSPERDGNRQGQPAVEPVLSGELEVKREPVPGTDQGTTSEEPPMAADKESDK